MPNRTYTVNRMYGSRMFPTAGRSRPLLFIVMALAVIAAACGSDSDSETDASADDPSTTETATPSDEATPAQADEPSVEPTETAEPTPTAPEEPALTASYRGVTEDTIKIGVVLFDLDAILELGVDIGYGDQTEHFQIVIDEVNSAGGILGRQIETVYRTISPVEAAQSDAACIELVEDEEVFLVMGTLRPADNVFCYTQLGDTPFIGALQGMTEEIFDESLVPILFPGKRPSRNDDALLTAMERDGAIEGGIIGVHGADKARLDRFESELLERGAAEVVKTVETASEADQLALAAELDVVVERYKTDGITAAIHTADNVAYLAAFNRAGYGVPVYTLSPDVMSDIIYDHGATDAEVMLVTRVGGASASDLYRNGHEPTVACIDRWNDARPDEPAMPDPDEDELNNFGVILVACQNVDVLTMAATAAGPELTVDTFTAALDEVGQFETAASKFSSLSATKWDASDTAAIYKWSDEEGKIVWVADLDLG